MTVRHNGISHELQLESTNLCKEMQPPASPLSGGTFASLVKGRLRRGYLFFPVFLRETMNTLEDFFGVRVLRPPVTLPHIVFGRLVPRPCLPSPPPYGWSTGFIAVPRTVGRIPFQRLRPAFPKFCK